VIEAPQDGKQGGGSATEENAAGAAPGTAWDSYSTRGASWTRSCMYVVQAVVTSTPLKVHRLGEL